MRKRTKIPNNWIMIKWTDERVEFMSEDECCVHIHGVTRGSPDAEDFLMFHQILNKKVPMFTHCVAISKSEADILTAVAKEHGYNLPI